MPTAKTRTKATAGASDRSTVPAAVRAIITRNPSLYECLKMKVLNYNAVAGLIADDVEQMVGKPVNQNTVVAAIMRFSNEHEREVSDDEPLGALREAKLNLVTGVSDIRISCPAERQGELVGKILEMASEGRYSVRVNQFPTYVKVATSSAELEEKIRKMKDVTVPMTEERYAELHVEFAPDATPNPGMIAYITDLLFRNGVGTVNGFFANEDIILAIDEDYASRAFESLRREISRMLGSG